MVDAAYIFPGQGVQAVGMGRDLYEKVSASREIFEKANDALGFDLAKLCFEGPSEELVKSQNSQPAILCVSVACLAAFESKYRARFSPKFAAGLSLGEITAIVAAGAIGFEDAVRFVHRRGSFMEKAAQQNPGKMAAIIGLQVKDVEGVCREAGAEIANLNSPDQIVISGKTETVERAVALAKEKGAKRAVILDVNGPYHSSLMEPVGERIAEELSKIKISQPKFPIVSNVTAKPQTLPGEIRDNLIVQVSRKTRWEESMRYIIACGINTFFEMGPGKVLKGLMRRIDENAAVYNIENVQSLEVEYGTEV